MQYKDVLDEKASYGHGPQSGPAVIMTDNCSELGDALRQNRKRARLVLCIFHLMQQLWRCGYSKAQMEYDLKHFKLETLHSSVKDYLLCLASLLLTVNSCKLVRMLVSTDIKKDLSLMHRIQASLFFNLLRDIDGPKFPYSFETLFEHLIKLAMMPFKYGPMPDVSIDGSECKMQR